MKDLALRDLLRYGIAGGVFLLSVFLVHDVAGIYMTRVDNLGGAATVLGLALALGALLYSFHRALVFPPILRCQLKHIGEARERLGPDIRIWTVVDNAEFELDTRRWRSDDIRMKHLTEWADQVHLLYASAQAIIFGVLFDFALPNGLSLSPTRPVNLFAVMLLLMAIFLFAIAWLSHRRLLVYVVRILWPTQGANESAA